MMEEDTGLPFLGDIKRPHFCDETINIGDFCKSFSQEVAQVVNSGLQKNSAESVLAVSMEMSVAAVNEVAKICSVDQLTCKGEPPRTAAGRTTLGPDFKTSFPNIQSDLCGLWGDTLDEEATRVLKSLEYQKRKAALIRRKSVAGRAWSANLRYLSEIRLESDAWIASSRRFPMRSFDVSTPVVAVRVYQNMPAFHTPGGCRAVFNLSQELACLGSNRLTELRDCISCPNDNLVVNDCSASPANTRPVPAKAVYPSGFFYVNRVFYVDRRKWRSIDYSEVIREWAASRGVTDLTVRSMEEVTVQELTVRLGYPYVYVHQGRCQHLMVFSDVRLFHPTNQANRRSYPLVQATRRFLRPQCQVCDRRGSKWLTTHHELTPTEPTYYCDACFRGFNFKRNGQPAAGFRAYPYDPSGTFAKWAPASAAVRSDNTDEPGT